MKRRGRPKKFPDYARVRRAMVRFKEMTTPEKRLFLIEAIEAAPDAVPELSIQIGAVVAPQPEARALP